MKKQVVSGLLLGGLLMPVNVYAAEKVQLTIHKLSYSNSSAIDQAPSPDVVAWKGEPVYLTVIQLNSHKVGDTPLNQVGARLKEDKSAFDGKVIVDHQPVDKVGQLKVSDLSGKGIYAVIETGHPKEEKDWSDPMVFELKGTEQADQVVYLKNKGKKGSDPGPSKEIIPLSPPHKNEETPPEEKPSEKPSESFSHEPSKGHPIKHAVISGELPRTGVALGIVSTTGSIGLLAWLKRKIKNKNKNVL